MSVTYKNRTQQIIRSLVSGRAAEIIAPVAVALREQIRAATPTLTGETRDSIASVQHSKFGHTIYTPLLKAVYIEYGTEDTEAFMMFRKTFDQNADKMAKRLEDDFKSHIETAVPG
jgi:hypothetical protein